MSVNPDLRWQRRYPTVKRARSKACADSYRGVIVDTCCVTCVYYRKIGVLEIRGGDYRIIPVELRTVRPFIFEDIRLSDIDGLVGTDWLVSHCMRRMLICLRCLWRALQSDAPDQLQEITHILESKVTERQTRTSCNDSSDTAWCLFVCAGQRDDSHCYQRVDR